MCIKSTLFAFLLLVCIIMIRVDCSPNCIRGTYNATYNSCICPAYFFGNTCALLHSAYCNSTKSASSQACNSINVNCAPGFLCIDTFSDLSCQNCTGCMNNSFHDQYTCKFCSLQCLRGTLDNNTCTCVCPPNFYGDRCENINSTNCDANFTRSFACENNSICLNGGSCNDYFDNLECSNCSSCANVTFEEQYKCNCSEYFNGTDCENCTLTCDRGILDLNPCQCMCPGNSTGIMCETCSLECLRGTFDNNSCTCDCPPNFYGYSCEYYNVTNCDAFTNSDACNSSSVSCLNGGTCTDLFSDLECSNCSSCANVPFEEQSKCNCLEYFNGTNCENCTLTCDRGMLNSSTCQCICPGNSTGIMCETCSLLQCLRGTFDDDECMCNCPPNFYGDRCEYYNSTHCDSSNSTNSCNSSSVSCLNGGTCTDLFSDLDCKNCTSCSEVPFEEQYKCDCLGNFNGIFCENCTLTCDRGWVNSSTCQCMCPGNSTGSLCEICSLECLRGTLDNNTCTCDCPPNFYGDRCEYYNSTYCDSSNTTDACSSSSVSCLNGGNCTDLFSDLDCNNCSSCLGIPFNQQYECDCPESYSGEICQTCNLNCTRGILKTITCKCDCPGNSTGVLCQNCDLQCMGGWINDSSCTCNCASRFSGYECEIFTPDQCNNNTNRSLVCESSMLCLNGGNCVDSYSMLDCNTCSNCSNSSLSQLYKCNCLDGYIGDRCDIIFDSCDPNPCNYGGICTNLIGSANYSCTCLDGYSGDTCDIVTVTQTSNTGAIVGALVGVIIFIIILVVSTLVLFIMAYILIKKQRKGKVTISPNNDSDDDTEKTPLE